MIQSFFRVNRAACDWIEARLPKAFTRSFNRLYETILIEEMNRSRKRRILDIGGGKKCFVADFKDPDQDPSIVAIDIAEEELKRNTQIADRVVGDVTRELPFAEGSFDVITSRSLLEHLSDTQGFFRHAFGVMRPGGSFIHLCPGKFAPFALCNQLLPNRVAQQLLYFFHPSFQAECGFKAYYDGTYCSAMKRKLERAGFVDIQIHLRYYQSIYFNFFLPFYLASVIYDLAVSALGLKNLASQLIIVAKRPEAAAVSVEGSARVATGAARREAVVSAE